MLRHRLQVLLDEDRHDRLTREAQRRGVSVGSLVRDAIDELIPSDGDRRREAIARILAAPPMPVPDDPMELKREIVAGREEPFRRLGLLDHRDGTDDADDPGAARDAPR